MKSILGKIVSPYVQYLDTAVECNVAPHLPPPVACFGEGEREKNEEIPLYNTHTHTHSHTHPQICVIFTEEEKKGKGRGDQCRIKVALM